MEVEKSVQEQKSLQTFKSSYEEGCDQLFSKKAIFLICSKGDLWWALGEAVQF